MARTTKADREEAIKSLRESLRLCGPDGDGTLTVEWIGGGPSSTGRIDYYELRIVQPDHETGRPIRTHWLNRLFCSATGYRFNKAREAVVLGGCGYSKTYQIVEQCAQLAGHPIFVDARDCAKWMQP